MFLSKLQKGEGECYKQHLVLEWKKKKLVGERELDVKMKHWHNVFTSDVCKEDDQDTPANKPDVPKTKKEAPPNEDGLSTKHDIESKSTIPRVFPVADVSNNARTAKGKNSIPSLMSNGKDAPTRRKTATWEPKKNTNGSLQNL